MVEGALITAVRVAGSVGWMSNLVEFEYSTLRRQFARNIQYYLHKNFCDTNYRKLKRVS